MKDLDEEVVLKAFENTNGRTIYGYCGCVRRNRNF